MSKGATAYGRTHNRLPFLTQALGTVPRVAVERTSVEVFRCNHQTSLSLFSYRSPSGSNLSWRYVRHLYSRLPSIALTNANR
jgi:hypothetical protein